MGPVIGWGNELAELSLTDWWPTRVVLLVLFVALVALIVWKARGWVSRTTLGSVAALLLVANGLAGVNAYYGYYLTLGQAIGLPGRDGASLSELNLHHIPSHGMVVAIDIPASKSRFAAGQAQLYLPPAWFSHPRPQLPVVLLLHGTPGDPTNWLDGGLAPQTLDNWAADHDGVAPIVVMPDINGSLTGDSECVNGPVGNVETYLTVDVPSFVESRFVTLPPGQNWAVAGLSEGGSCALMLALRHPDLFRTFGDYSGLAGPRDGDTNAVGDTVSALFGGSQSAFNAHEPGYLLTHQRFPHLAGWFEVGDQDQQPLQAAQQLAPLAQRAGITTRLVVVPGQSHTFVLWSQAFADSLPWIVAQLTPAADPHPAAPPRSTTPHS